MSQAYLPKSAYAPFARLRAWIMALQIEPSPENPAAEKPETEDERYPGREDAFYLSLGLQGYW